MSQRNLVCQFLSVALLPIGLICWGSAELCGGEADAALQAQLAAGEFGPARQAAAGLRPAERDRWLARIAEAQAGAGARNAAFSSLSEIRDDRVRTQSLQAIGERPVGDRWGRGGAALADFDTLIDLITTTIAPQTWDDVGGPGAIESFPSGVLVDAAGLLKRGSLKAAGGELATVRGGARSAKSSGGIRTDSPLRKVSLNRLERELQLNRALGRDPDEAMKCLAGIYKIKYVFLYPETGDVVIAGPAGDWAKNGEQRYVHVGGGQPVLQLDDLIVLLRNSREKTTTFGCAITPTKERLASTQAFLKESAKTSLRPTQRERWLKELRATLGLQEIDVFGIEPRTRVAQVLVEADYRMKLVGMGLEDGVLGVTSYLDSVRLDENGNPPGMNVLRWWFTMNYDAIRASEDHNAFEIRGGGVKVLSENELLSERGERIHTGTSDELNREFARSFTKHFEALAAKYPIYAELRNVFDLALVAALINTERLDERAAWHMPFFGDEDRCQVRLGVAPKEVETVINHRVLKRRHIVAGVSGGVSADASQVVARNAIEKDEYGLVGAEHAGAKPAAVDRRRWWWD